MTRKQELLEDKVIVEGLLEYSSTFEERVALIKLLALLNRMEEDE